MVGWRGIVLVGIALTVGVVGTETPPIVLENSDVTVPGVPACIELLGAIADVVESSGGQRA